MSTDKFSLYRFFNKDGTSKDWAIRRNPDGSLTRAWGKTGAKLQLKTSETSAYFEAQNLLAKKIDKGYQFVGEYSADYLGIVDSLVKNVEDQKPVELCIYWRLKLGRFFDPNDKKTFYDCHTKLLEQLSQSTWVHPFPEHELDLYSFVGTGKSTAGKLLKTAGVHALLYLMALKKFAPPEFTVYLSHEDSVDISAELKLEARALAFFDTHLTSVQNIAECIGLLEKPLDLTTIAPNTAELYF